jgi:hypothetical protein
MNLFERLDQGRPVPEPKPVSQPGKDSAQRLLDFLQRWRKPTIRSADILIYGPRCTRRQEDADNAIAILTKYGWLIPQKTNQSNWRLWRITRKPTIHPTLAD